MLVVEGLTVRYGGIVAVNGVDLEVLPGELVALLGSNGAGKSSFIAGVLGLVRRASGRIAFQGVDISSSSPERIVSSGVAAVPEGRGILGQMTVKENLLLGGYHLKVDVEARIEEGLDRFPILRSKLGDPAWMLSGGQQQMLAIARALVSRPALLILDEPTLGLSPVAVGELFHLLREIHAGGQTILLAEQNAKRALSCADRAYVFEAGRVTLAGDAAWVLNHAGLHAAYLGAREKTGA